MGALKLLEIIAYSDNSYSCPTGKSFQVMLNPGNYHISKGIHYQKDKSHDGGKIPTYQGYDDEKLDFEFMLDGTGTLSNWWALANGAVEKKTIVADLLKQLEDTVYTYVGTAHEPPFLKLTWGTLSYQGRLLSMDKDCILFNSEGNPIRAKIKINIGTYIDQKTQNKKKNRSSPDLTHIVTVKAGDTLPLLCQRIYKSSAYCTEVAEVNNLTGFRLLEPGIQLLFPPLTNE